MDNAAELARVTEQEATLILQRFTHDDAWSLGAEIRERAFALSAPLAIEIRIGTTRRFACMLEGATPDNYGWIDRKMAVAWRFERSSYAMGLRLKSGETMFERFGLDSRLHAAAGGAIPIRVASIGMVGVVAVSGLPQAEDHELVAQALLALKQRQVCTD